jgi:hypothetical protein
MPPSFLVRFVGGVVAVAVVVGCSSADGADTASSTTTSTTTTAPGEFSLVGSWERTGGDFSVLQGMVVEVTDPVDEGTIVSVPRNPYRFQVGDVKWDDITAVSDGRFRIRDLVREAETGLASFVTGIISPTPDGAMLELTFPSTGTVQVWTRLP